MEFVGSGSVGRLGEVLTRFGARRVLLVTGRGSWTSSGAASAVMPFLDGIETRRFSAFDVNPKLEQARAGLALHDAIAPDVVLAVGGGSVIDMAKAITFLAAQARDQAEVIVRGGGERSGQPVPLVAVPTTAGTGSEATHFAVVYIGDDKFSLADPRVRPAAAIVDAGLIGSAPRRVAACAALDALAQATESLWAVASTEESRRHAEQALAIGLPAAVTAVVERDPAAIEAMARASNLAGKAIDISKTTAAHAFSYPITARHAVPHGHAVALTLGHFMVINAEADAARLNGAGGEAHREAVFERLCALYGRDHARGCRERWTDLVGALGLETDPARLGIRSAEDRRRIVSNVNLERLGNNPITPNDDEIARLFRKPAGTAQ